MLSSRKALSMSAHAATAALLATATPADAQDTASSAKPAPVVVIVRIAKPWYAPKPLVVKSMRDTIPTYARLPGLAFKAYSLEQGSGDYGGLYYWRDRSIAQAWFSTAWYDRVRKERGTKPNVRFFEAPLSLDNSPGGTPANNESASVGTLVEIPIPAGVSREQILAEFAAAAPTYQKVPGLMRKHFTIGDAGTFGGVYLWKDDASAHAWFNYAWHERVRKTYGAQARLEWFDTPILLPGQRPDNVVAASVLITAAP